MVIVIVGPQCDMFDYAGFEDEQERWSCPSADMLGLNHDFPFEPLGGRSRLFRHKFEGP